ncbi:hypothetical protein PL11201_530185 [Planktothrix sp. PCC 11201]|nr:hypothetical protein PL11201_530185 [Planktothrix sp. PCC 11201]
MSEYNKFLIKVETDNDRAILINDRGIRLWKNKKRTRDDFIKELGMEQLSRLY